MPCAKKGALCASLFFVAAAFIALDNHLKVEHDSAFYITLGEALATGQGYREIFFAESPPHTKYPPIFPLLLAPVVYFFRYYYLAMKLIVVAFAVGGLYLLYILCRNLSDDLMASLVVIATATSHGLLFYTESIMTEVPYLLFSLLTLYWLHRCASQGVWGRKPIVIAVGLIPLVYLTRLIGLSLLLAAVAYLALDGKDGLRDRMKRAIGLGSVAAIPAVIWFLHNWLVSDTARTAYTSEYGTKISSSPSAIDGVRIFIERLMINFYKYALHSTRVIFFYMPAASQKLFLVPMVALVVGGFLWRVVRQRTILEYYVFFYMCGVVGFPGTRPHRYLVPLIPFIWYYLLTAVWQVFAWLRGQASSFGPAYQRRVALAAQLLFVALVISNGAAAVLLNIVHGGREDYYHVTGEDGYVGVMQWVETHTPPESVFIWAKPALRFIWTRRKAVNYPPTHNREALLQFIHLRQVGYVVVDSFSEIAQQELRPMVEKYSDRFSLVYSNDVSQVYKVTNAPPSKSSGRMRVSL